MRALTILILLGAAACSPDSGEARIAGGDVDHGAALVKHHACGACHVIPGVRGADARVGPSLDGIARQAILAGRLPNTPTNLARWVKTPQEISPGNVMPNMEDMTDEDARDIAAFLYTLR